MRDEITTRKQARAMGLRDGEDAAMSLYREQVTLAQDEAVLNDDDPDFSDVVIVLERNTDPEAWGEYAGTCSFEGSIPQRWREVYERAVCKGGARQSASLLKDHQESLLAVDLSDP